MNGIWVLACIDILVIFIAFSISFEIWRQRIFFSMIHNGILITLSFPENKSVRAR